MLNHLDNVDRVIEDLTNATRTREVTEKVVGPDGAMVETKKLVTEIDHRTRRSAIDALKDLRDMVASKETKVNINNGNQIGSVTISGRSFEERVRTKRAQNGLQTQTEDSDDPADSETVDAEFEDVDPDDPESDSSPDQAENDESPQA